MDALNHGEIVGTHHFPMRLLIMRRKTSV